MIDSTLLAEIFVENTRGKLNTSSGCLITGNRIITAAHVLDDAKPGGRRVVRLYRDDEMPRRVERMVWNGRDPEYHGTAKAVDVCVLEFAADQHLAHPAFFLRETAINSSLKVEGRGFPAGSRESPEDSRERSRPQAESFLGDCTHFEFGTPDRTIHLHSNNGFGIKWKWKGASGFPVFYRDELVAIAFEFKGERTLDTIDCVPIMELLRDYPSFKAAIDYDRYTERRTRFDDVLGEVVDLLRNKQADDRNDPPQGNEVFRKLNRIFGERVLEVMDPGQVSGNPVQALAGFLLRIEPLELLEAVEQIHAENEYDGKPNNSLEGLHQLQNLILPIAIQGLLAGLIATCRTSSAPLSAPLALKTTAEILMAGVDGRKTRFILPQDTAIRADGPPSPIGASLLPDPPEQGLEGDQESQVGSMLEDLARSRHPFGIPADGVRAIDRMYPNDRKAKNKTIADSLSRSLKRLLRRRGQSTPLRFYFALEPSEDEQQAATLDAALCELQGLVKEIVVLRLGNEFLKFGEGDELEVTKLLSEIMQKRSDQPR